MLQIIVLIKFCSVHIFALCIQRWFNDLPPQSAAGFDSSFFSFFLPLASGWSEPSHLKESKDSQSTRPNRAHSLVTLLQAPCGPWYILGSFLGLRFLGFLLWLWLCRARTASLTFSNDLCIGSCVLHNSLFASLWDSLQCFFQFLSVSFSLCFHLPLHVSFAHLLLRQSQEMVDGTVQIFVSTIPKTGQKPWKEQGKNSKENCKKCNRLHSKNSCDQNIQMVGGLYTVHVSAWQLGPHLPGNWRSKGGPDRIICACWQKLSKSSPMAQAKAVCIRICRVYWWPCWCYSWSFLAHSKRYLSLHYSSIFFMTWFLHAVNLSLLACNESVNRNFVLHRGIGKLQLCLAAYKLVLVKPKRFSVNFACASSASPVQLDSLYIYILYGYNSSSQGCLSLYIFSTLQK